VWKLYSDKWARAAMLSDMDRVMEPLGQTGAGRQAAEVVLRELQSRAKPSEV